MNPATHIKWFMKLQDPPPPPYPLNTFQFSHSLNNTPHAFQVHDIYTLIYILKSFRAVTKYSLHLYVSDSSPNFIHK